MSLSFHFRFDVAATKRKSGWHDVIKSKIAVKGGVVHGTK